MRCKRDASNPIHLLTSRGGRYEHAAQRTFIPDEVNSGFCERIGPIFTARLRSANWPRIASSDGPGLLPGGGPGRGSALAEPANRATPVASTAARRTPANM